MKELATLSISLGSDLMTTVRLTTGGLCALAGLDFDAGEDCKVCVTESLLLLLHNGYAGASVRYTENDGLSVTVRGEGKAEPTGENFEDDISFALLGALNDHLEINRRDGLLYEIAFRFLRRE